MSPTWWAASDILGSEGPSCWKSGMARSSCKKVLPSRQVFETARASSKPDIPIFKKGILYLEASVDRFFTNGLILPTNLEDCIFIPPIKCWMKLVQQPHKMWCVFYLRFPMGFFDKKCATSGSFTTVKFWLWNPQGGERAWTSGGLAVWGTVGLWGLERALGKPGVGTGDVFCTMDVEGVNIKSTEPQREELLGCDGCGLYK